MKTHHIAVAAVTAAMSAAVVVAAPASANIDRIGTQSLATVLAADGNHFDRNNRDFDITHRAVTTVLKANPDSAVAVLADGDVRLTAFLPTDLAFRRLVRDLTDDWQKSERTLFRTLVRTAGVETIEAVLLYHVVPGTTITSTQAAKADGAVLVTALESATITVNVRNTGAIYLQDQDTNDTNPMIESKSADLNKGNKQIAHGIDRVLRPINL